MRARCRVCGGNLPITSGAVIAATLERIRDVDYSEQTDAKSPAYLLGVAIATIEYSLFTLLGVHSWCAEAVIGLLVALQLRNREVAHV